MSEFIKYYGGTQPVSDKTNIDVKLGCGGEHIFKGYTGATAPWFAKGGVGAYLVIKPKLAIAKENKQITDRE